MDVAVSETNWAASVGFLSTWMTAHKLYGVYAVCTRLGAVWVEFFRSSFMKLKENDHMD